MEPVLIYQGSNTPITLTLPDDKQIDDISVYLNSGKNILIAKNRLLKSWAMPDVSISGKEVSCPITQEESAAFPYGDANIEVKVKSGSSVTIYESVPAVIIKRNDKDVIL